MSDLAINKKAGFDYELLERFEAGLMLLGHEVKSAKIGNAHLSGSYVVVRDNGAWLIGSHIGRYRQASPLSGYDPERSRQLLLHKKEIRYLQGKATEKRLTFIPLKLYTKAGKIKLEFALARSKKKYEKREIIKKRDILKNIRSALKRN